MRIDRAPRLSGLAGFGLALLAAAAVWPAEEAVAPPQDPPASVAPEAAATDPPAADRFATGRDSYIRDITIPLFREGESGGELVEDLGAAAWRRRAVELRRLHGPEALVSHVYAEKDVDGYQRSLAAARVPLREDLDLACLLGRDAWVNRPTPVERRQEAEFYHLEARPQWKLASHTLLWAALLGYSGDISGAGIKAGLDATPTPGVFLRAQAYAWRPWDEITRAVAYDGRRHGGGLVFSWTCLDRVTLGLAGGAEAYELGPRAPESGSAGHSGEGLARLDVNWIRRPGTALRGGFLEQRAEGEESLEFGVVSYAQYRVKRYWMRDDFTLVTVTPRTEEFRAGVEYRQPFSARLGLTLGGYLGRDAERKMEWGKLWGFQTRLILIPTPRWRLWLGFEQNFESARRVKGARTRLWSLGCNFNF